ncbi:uncharacterized protein LOC143285596 [Babylonia areolata]|uniref:uncharacterized protein LOC143285596 n=1 Tax=Babylonia areolata TaxID=304850 RepID=UPI003FD1FC76
MNLAEPKRAVEDRQVEENGVVVFTDFSLDGAEDFSYPLEIPDLDPSLLMIDPGKRGGRGESQEESTRVAPKKTPEGKDSDYDFEAMQSLQQATGTEPIKDDLTSFSLQHTHTEYQYKEDGSAVVQSDIYKRTFNWSSDEEGTIEGETEEVTEIVADPMSEAIQDGIMEFINNVQEVASEDDDPAGVLQGVSPESAESPEIKEPEPKKLSHQDTQEGKEEDGAEAPEPAQEPPQEGGEAVAETAEQPEGGEGEAVAETAEQPEGGEAVAETAEQPKEGEGEAVAETAEQPKEGEGEAVAEQQEQPEGGEGQEGAEPEPVADASNNMTNNYLSVDKHRATYQWVEESYGAVHHSDQDWLYDEMDWANHCSRTSPFRVVTPRHNSSYGSSPDFLHLPDHHHHHQSMATLPCDEQREADRWECHEYSPSKSWSSQGSREGTERSATGRWLPSPRLDFFPVNSHTVAAHKAPWHNPMEDEDSKNLLGEVAFQLERRVLDYVFANSLPDLSPHNSPSRGAVVDTDTAARRRHMDGYTVSNIGEMISHEALAGEKYSRGTERMLRERLRTMLDLLTPMGYDLLEHGSFSQDIINKYGLLSSPPPPEARDPKSEVGIPGISVSDLQNFIFTASESDEERDTLLLVFDCLRMLSIEDGRPLFVW